MHAPLPYPQLWITPALDGPITGGTLYNASIISALAQLGAPVQQCTLHDASAVANALTEPTLCWLDSLYLAHASQLGAQLPTRHVLGLLLHYLPSTLQPGTALRALELTALDTAACVLTTGQRLATQVAPALGERPVWCVEPALVLPHDHDHDQEQQQLQRTAPTRDPASAVMVCNLTPNKGVLPFLRALGAATRPADAYHIHVLGTPELDPPYARACQALVASSPSLGARVHFAGACSHREVLRRIGHGSLFVSASLSESFGMALAEARALGTPLLALRGDNVASQVSAADGGELCDDHAALAAAFLQLLRDPVELERRLHTATSAAAARAPRSWHDAGSELLALCASAAGLFER